MMPNHSFKTYSNSHLTCALSGYKPPNLHKWGPGVRDIYALHYIVSGKGTLETQNMVFSLNPGDSFVIFPHTEVFYYPDPQDPWEYVWIEFRGEEAERLLAMTSMEPNHPVVVESPINMVSLFPVSNQGYAHPYEKLRAEGRLRTLLSYYMEYYPRESEAMDYVELAKEYIENNFWRTNLSVADIVKAVKLERSYMFRLFKESAGMSLSKYLAAYRIQRASALLRTSGLSVKSIACSVGYHDPLHFSKVFKKTTSYTPSEYMTLYAGNTV